MAHFAQLDENNTVTQIIVVHNNELASGSEIEVVDGMIQEKQVLSETQGVSFLQGLYGSDTRWVQTSYNGNFRGKYAAIGDTYDAGAGEFLSPNVAPSADVPVVAPAVETQQTVVLEAPVGLGSTDIPALTSADIQALTSEQISGLE
jgi:hypothetical protein